MARKLANVFKALGDRNRIRIVKMLQERELCVCEVREVLELSNSTVSKHLSILRAAEIITDDKVGKWVNFKLNTRSTDRVIRELIPLIKQWESDDEQILKDAQKVKKVDRKKICSL